MCIPSSHASASCSGSCADCPCASSDVLEATARAGIAWTAVRVFVLPLLAGTLGAALAPPAAALQLAAGIAGFSLATALLRRLPGGRLL